MTENRIRVLHVVPDLEIGGAERHLIAMVGGMDPERFVSSVVCIGRTGALFPELPASGVAALALHLNGKRNAPRALLGLIATMRRIRPDVVVMRGYNAEVLGRLAALAAGVAHTVVWVHTTDDKTSQRSRLRRVTERLLMYRTTAYFGVAQAQLPFLLDDLGYPADKVRIIRNGVDPAQFDAPPARRDLTEFGWTSDDPVVGTIAGLRPEKDHATLLRAARMVVDQIPQTKFLLVGDGPEHAALLSLCAELGLAESVHFAGPRTDVGTLLAGVDVFALSSTREALPIALLEAMACRRPAVCTAVDGVAEVIQHGRTGFLVTPGNAHDLAARLIQVLRDPEMARRFGAAGRARVVAEFTVSQQITATERAFSRIVCGDGDPWTGVCE